MKPKPKPYIPRPWQLPHMLVTPVGGKVLIVERCERLPLGPVGTVLSIEGVGDLRTTAIDLRRVDTINSKRHDEVFRAGYPFGYDVKTLDENPWNTFKRRWLADNPGATWGDWAWFITAERAD